MCTGTRPSSSRGKQECNLSNDRKRKSAILCKSWDLQSTTCVKVRFLVFPRSHAQIGDEGATQIASALKDNKTIEILILGGQKIGPSGAAAIGEGLRKNMTVTELHLPNNKLGYEVTLAHVTRVRPLYCLQGLRIRAGDIFFPCTSIHTCDTNCTWGIARDWKNSV